MKIRVISEFCDKFHTSIHYKVGTVLDFGTERANDIISRKLGVAVEETEQGPDFYFLRRPLPNPEKQLCKRQIGMLWRRELNHLLELNAMPAYRDKSKKAVAEKLLTAVCFHIEVIHGEKF